MQESYFFILSLSVALAAGLVGSFALMKRMSLAGDVISHIALPGLGVAALLNINPMIGAGAALLLGVLLIAHLEGNASLTSDTAIGVLFTASVAIGALLLGSREELIDALFGGFRPLSTTEFGLGIFAVLIVIMFIVVYKNRLILSLFSPELAASSGLNIKKLNLYYLLIFALTILLGLRILGALLVGALIIIPGAIGKQLSNSLSQFLFFSSAASVVSTGIGFFIASQHNLELGPVIVAVATVLFGLSLLKK